MEIIFTELALYGSNNECARTDNVFSPISEVCDGTVSLGVSRMKDFLKRFFFGVKLLFWVRELFEAFF